MSSEKSEIMSIINDFKRLTKTHEFKYKETLLTNFKKYLDHMKKW